MKERNATADSKLAPAMERTLIVRSGPSELFDRALANVTGRGRVVVDVYCPAQVSPSLRGRENINAIIDTGWDHFFRASAITSQLVAQLSSPPYDHVIILYNDGFGEGYGALRKLAFAITPGRVSSFNVNGVSSRLRSEGGLERFFLPRKWFYGVLIAFFTIEIVAVTLYDRVTRLFKPAPPPPPRPGSDD